MDRKQIASIQESIGETSSQSVVVAVDRYYIHPQLKIAAKQALVKLPSMGIIHVIASIIPSSIPHKSINGITLNKLLMLLTMISCTKHGNGEGQNVPSHHKIYEALR